MLFFSFEMFTCQLSSFSSVDSHDHCKFVDSTPCLPRGVEGSCASYILLLLYYLEDFPSSSFSYVYWFHLTHLHWHSKQQVMVCSDGITDGINYHLYLAHNHVGRR